MARVRTEFFKLNSPGLGLNFVQHVEAGLFPQSVSDITLDQANLGVEAWSGLCRAAPGDVDHRDP